MDYFKSGRDVGTVQIDTGCVLGSVCGRNLFPVFALETQVEKTGDGSVCAVFGDCMFGGDGDMKVKGSFTIEAAIIVPLILFLFSVLVHILFYYHDKNVLLSTAHETAAVGSRNEELSELELEYYFFSRMEGKMLLLNRVECLVTLEEQTVTIMCDGSKDYMKIAFEYRMPKSNPEAHIRKIKKVKEGIVK